MQPLQFSTSDLRVALEWAAADERDVVRVVPRPESRETSPSDLRTGLRAWTRRIAVPRTIAAARRALLVGAAAILPAAVVLRLADASAVWSLAAGAAVLIPCAAVAASRRGGEAGAARLLDRDLALHDHVTTALELAARPAPSGGLAAAALRDGADAVARSLGAARAAAAPARREWSALVLLAALSAAVILVPPLGGSSDNPAGADGTAGGAAVAAGQSGDGDLGGGPDLRGFSRGDGGQPRITATSAGTVEKPGSLSGHSPYGAGIASQNPQGDVSAVRPLGADASSKSAQAAAASTGAASESAGAGGGDRSVSVNGPPGTGGSASVGGAAGSPSLGAGGGGGNGGATPQNGAGVKGGSSAGNAAGGAGASAPGHSSGSGRHGGASGGATAGGTRGSSAPGHGLVPQLAFGGKLPIQPGYAPSQATRRSSGEPVSQSLNGGGGSARVGVAGPGGSAGSGPGLRYVPPAGSILPAVDRQLLLGYFAPFGRITAAGW
jgi:hypothetical protein